MTRAEQHERREGMHESVAAAMAAKQAYIDQRKAA